MSLRELDVVDTADDDIKIYEEPWEWFEPSAGTRFRRVHESLVGNDLQFGGRYCRNDRFIDFSLSNLTSLTYRTYAYSGDLLNVPMESLNGMLVRRSPNLKVNSCTSTDSLAVLEANFRLRP